MKVLDVVAEYPCPRACKTALAIGTEDVVCRRPPTALPDAYKRVMWRMDADGAWFRDTIAKSDADTIMFHAEMYSSWLAEYVREGAGDRRVVVNVHDFVSARHQYVPDVHESDLFRVADVCIFVTEAMAEFARDVYGYDGEYIVVPNYGSSTMFVDRRMLPHIGGVVYEGGIDPRGADGAWRDFSAVADALSAAGGGLHIYPANTGVDYGIVHPMVLDYRTLIHRLARHDWGLTGTVERSIAWEQTVPNKVFDYLAAGIPFVALRTPILKDFADEGFGILVDSIEAITDLPSNKPFVKAIRANRHRFTMEAMADTIRSVL